MMDTSTKPYIRHGPVYFVPVLPQRLAFAVLTWRAMRELELGSTDAVAVSLPQSVREQVIQCVERLNSDDASGRLSTLYLRDREGDAREFLPITPADGIIEAVRSCIDLKIPKGDLHFVDQEIAPGHLIGQSCEDDPGILDDDLALLRGPEWYLRMIQPVLSHPPLRWEPVSTWREAFMAEKIRAMIPFYKRILFVCHAAHVEPIRTRLSLPALPLEEQPLPKTRLEKAKPADIYKLIVLDDIPRLVEVFERMRADGSAAQFTKQSALVSAALDVPHMGDPSRSIRNLRVFWLMTERVAHQSGRNSPTLSQIASVAPGCLGPRFAERLGRHLLGYREEISVDRMIPAAGRPDDEPVFSRSCNPQKTWYTLWPVPEILRKDGPEENITWPPYRFFVAAMRVKALRIGAGRRRIRRSSRFSGSFGHGIDVRRTLNNLYRFRSLSCPPSLSAMSDLYVKTDTLHMSADSLVEEPVVWIFEADGQGRDDLDKASMVIRNSRDFATGFTSTWDCFKDPRPRRVVQFGEREITIWTYDLFGRVIFCDPAQSYDSVDAGSRSGSQHVPLYRSKDPILSKLDTELQPGSDWQRLLIEGALSFSKQQIIIVAPVGFAVPTKCAKLAAQSRKTINTVPAESFFTADELWKFRHGISVESKWNLKEGIDRSSQEVSDRLTAELSHVVEPDW